MTQLLSFPHDGVFISDGLSVTDAKTRYLHRRNTLLDQLSHPLLLVGPTSGPSGTYPWAHIHRSIFQDPYILYLTGINQPEVALFLDPKTRETTLFLPKKDSKLEFWEGVRFGSGDTVAINEVTEITGITSVINRDTLADHVKQHINNQSLGMIWNTIKGKRKTDQTWDDLAPVIRALKRAIPQLTITNESEVMWAQRLVMDTTDIHNITLANTYSAEAYTSLLRHLTTFKSEHDAWAHLDYEINKRSPFGPSFPSIVASGKNAAVLHYTKNNEPFLPNSMLLTDFGVRWYAMHADVTRTAPTTGKYTPLQRLLIDIVLGAQDVVQSLARPGISINELNDQCWTYINTELARKITQRAGTVQLPYATAPHNVSHFLGHQVHDGDPNREYRTRPLKAGNIISNEPGIYGEISLIMNGVRYQETIGIRIEDDLLITEDGATSLTPCIKDPLAIERIIQEGR